MLSKSSKKNHAGKNEFKIQRINSYVYHNNWSAISVRWLLMLRVVGRKEDRGACRHIVTVKRIVKTIVQAILVILVTRVLIVTQVFVRQLMLNTIPYLQWIGHLKQGAAPRAVLG